MTQASNQGEYARIFEEEYNAQTQRGANAGRQRLQPLPAGIRRRQDPQRLFFHRQENQAARKPGGKRGESAGESDDVDAYDLILKDKERLLSFEEPVRFIFSHSALREGWDNPNVFVICTLKHSDNTISRRQEVGRGLAPFREPEWRPHGRSGNRSSESMS